MTRQEIALFDFNLNPHHLWLKQWLLLASGEFAKNHYNAMTVAWGSFGTMWNKPFVQVVVRPTRYTFEFMEKYDTFTLSAFSAEYQKSLRLLGTKSGRHVDKIKESMLTPIASQKVAAPGFAEAELIIECQKIYWQDLNHKNFIDPSIAQNYTLKDYHRIYFGEILFISGLSQYKNSNRSSIHFDK